MGETAFVFNCLGTSSLSKILEVFTSSCLLLLGGDRTDWSNLGLEIQAGEHNFGASLTTSCSHSSVIWAFFSSTIKLNCEDSSSTSSTSSPEIDRTISSEESGWVNFGLEVASLNVGGTDLQNSSLQQTLEELQPFSSNIYAANHEQQRWL